MEMAAASMPRFQPGGTPSPGIVGTAYEAYVAASVQYASAPVAYAAALACEGQPDAEVASSGRSTSPALALEVGDLPAADVYEDALSDEEQGVGREAPLCLYCNGTGWNLFGACGKCADASSAAGMQYASLYAAAPVQCPSVPVTLLAVSEFDEELEALGDEICIHEAARDKLQVELRSLRVSIAAAKSGSAGKGAGKRKLFALEDQLRAEIGNVSNVLNALYARMFAPPLAPRRRGGTRRKR